jgi:hypothetical protein
MGAAKLNGEDPREFLAGLASNIGLDKFRAATLVCASIATRTRTCFLQCWVWIYLYIAAEIPCSCNVDSIFFSSLGSRDSRKTARSTG